MRRGREVDYKRIACLPIVLALIAGCVTRPKPPAKGATRPPPATAVGEGYARYRCAGGEEIGVTFQAGGERALLERGGRSELLRRVVSASGARYSDGKTTFWSKGDTAMVESNGQIALRGCSALGPR